MLKNLRDELSKAHTVKREPPTKSEPPDVQAAIKRAIEALQALAKALEK